MVYLCADDYGLNAVSSMRILECIQKGALNKASVFPNLGKIELARILENENAHVGLHVNLVEGKCMAKAEEVPLLADPKGNLINSYGKLLLLSLFSRKEFEKQVSKELKAQIAAFLDALPADVPFCIDSHQHTHMIPVIFKALIHVLKDGGINVKYIRIPNEPLLPYLSTPSLYFTYKPINIIKQWFLKFLWFFNKPILKRFPIPTAYFMGILFSGKMDEPRVTKLLPKYIKLAEKHGKDIELLFHPGYLTQSETDFENKNIVFESFYLSANRKTEFDSIVKLSEGSEL